jgi:hypothetical protein
MRFFRTPPPYTAADLHKPADEVFQSDWLREAGMIPRTMTFRDLLHFEPTFFGRLAIFVDGHRYAIRTSLWLVTLNFGLSRALAGEPLGLTDLYAKPVFRGLER